jgi:hypothetical protein
MNNLCDTAFPYDLPYAKTALRPISPDTAFPYDLHYATQLSYVTRRRASVCFNPTLRIFSFLFFFFSFS